MCPAGVFAVCGVVAYAAVEDADQSVAQCAQGLMVHVSGSVVVMCSGAAAATWVNMARETSKWLFECDPQVSPRASHNLGEAHRTVHRAEVRVCKGNVYGA